MINDNAVKHLVEWLQESGIDRVDTNIANNCFATKQGMAKNLEENNSPEADKNIAEHPALNCNDLKELRQAIENFDGCFIKKTAINTVFYDGNEAADIMFIGEAPGANEDKQGIPFCGQSGKLLNNILSSIKLKREDIFITNTVFWRPPGNRRPTAEEIMLCRPFVEKTISIVAPKLIILVGSTAVESLLDKKTSMGKLRNQVFDYNNEHLTKSIKAMVIFHPSYLLRQPLRKKDMWFDMLSIKHNVLNSGS